MPEVVALPKLRTSFEAMLQGDHGCSGSVQDDIPQYWAASRPVCEDGRSTCHVSACILPIALQSCVFERKAVVRCV